MSDDEPFTAPFPKPRPPEVLKPGELLFEFLRGHDRFRCELRDHGPYGIEAQFYQNEEFIIGRRFDLSLGRTQTSREMAIQWAEEERKAIESGDGST